MSDCNILFNSTFEMELRIIALLSVNNRTAYSLDRILALDFISCYAEKFDFDFNNLHGNGQYLFGEISNRRLLMQEAIKNLVVRGLVYAKVDRGYFYQIEDIGEKYIASFEDAYSQEYLSIATNVNQEYYDCSDEELMEMIENKSLADLKGVN